MSPSSATSEFWAGNEIYERNSFGTNSDFIIYLHGKIIEDEGVDAEHPEHGRYEYFETLSYLETSGGQIISEVRPMGTNSVEYAEIVAGWIIYLLDTGVSPQRIFVVGFSKGAGIALYVSDMLDNPDINFVLIGICGEWTNSISGLSLSGRVLSLYETSDEFGGSCQALADRSPGVSSFVEIAYSTGEGHGAFYQAESFWLDDVIDWIKAAK
ncbi:MAG: alpha/beta hydrolase [Anaerolineales bacterium]|nr:alpha/beta hydrolase [Anaerolineales bacterium]